MSKEIENKNTIFVKSIAKYFMDFLETDFHKRKNPKRSIKLKSEDGLLIGLNLDKYKTFNNLIWKEISHSFNTHSINEIKKGSHKSDMPKGLLSLINEKISKISKQDIKRVIKKISEEIKDLSITYKDEYETGSNILLENIFLIIKEDLVNLFIKKIEKSLISLEISDENEIYAMGEDLSNILLELVRQTVLDLFKSLINNNKINAIKDLEDVFTPNDVNFILTEFFENFRFNDLFLEIFDIDKNKNILDKKEFYLYFCDITFNKIKYPIFYIPFDVRKNNNSFAIDFDSQIYINKKALEYIVQECNKDNSKKGGLDLISERIIYLADHTNDLLGFLQSIINEINNFFGLDKNIDLNDDGIQKAKSITCSVSNACYICLFDKSDEALVNDYEDILQLLSQEDDSVLSVAFNNLINDFIHKEPKTFDTDIYSEWDDLSSKDKLVFSAPIPLNSEQRRILSALNKECCKYITVEGPPGTGKSHTITAIVFDAILHNKSVLVLSDKKEALDVVEDKISETMNKVRHDNNFQNPILRLGKTGNTYNQILSTSSIESIKMHHRAVKKEFSSIEADIQKVINTLKEDLEAETLAYETIDIDEIYEVVKLEDAINASREYFDTEEILGRDNSLVELSEVNTLFLKIKELLEHKEFADLIKTNFNIDIKEFEKVSDLCFLKYIILDFLKIADNVKKHFSEKIEKIKIVNEFKDNDLKYLDNSLIDYQSLKHWLFGYIFKGKKVEEWDGDFQKHFYSFKGGAPHENIEDIKVLFEAMNYVNNLKSEIMDGIDFDYLHIAFFILTSDEFIVRLKKIVGLVDDIEYLTKILSNYPKTLKNLNIDASKVRCFQDNYFINKDELEFDKFLRYINLSQKLSKEFNMIPYIDYVNQKKNIESLVTTQMINIMDESVINFYEENKSTAKTLRNIIKNKQRFPKKEFVKLKEAFPCILAGIRDYAEYIPLEPEMFDLLIIDEASQVSIAQAFPALLRAKKILILGDKKQFSNVKAANARSDTNKVFLNDIKNVFSKNISKETNKLERLKKFDIKTSVLDFFEFISNYNAQLLKYFRGYKEIISYSNKFFYGDLQAMKIRGKNIDDVLKFSFIDYDNKAELIPNTNLMEIDFIISELKKMKDVASNLSVGIITPHTNQQKLIMEKITNLPESDYFFQKLRLKIMTFDTCQGEERDIIYYSMVATMANDHLWGVFIKNLKDIDLEEEGKVKAQRLNVGFSRAKECMHFVLSKNIDDYNGSIGEALRHYKNVLEEAKKEKDISCVDKNSKMEPEVMNWFYQTEFWNKNNSNIEFIPQFEIGKYLKQLDKFYNHPKYIVDFLLIYRDERYFEHKIIIEYDGFREHFKDVDEVNEFNYKNYYSEDDLIRQKTLESYGYKFIRINKFNIGENPIKALNTRIEDLLKSNFNGNKKLNNVYKTFEGLQNGEMKECPKCKSIKSLSDFRDDSLVSGYGRFCSECKSSKSKNRNNVVGDSITCPLCGEGMVLRTGRYGKFYGCSKYPYCRGTRRA